MNRESRTSQTAVKPAKPADSSHRRSRCNRTFHKAAVRNIIFVAVLAATPSSGFAQSEQQLITNGAFDQGSQMSGWQTTYPFNPPPCTANARSAPNCACFTDAAGLGVNNADGILYQDFYIPASATSATLRLYYNITTEETDSTQDYDYLYVTLQTTSGDISLLTRTNKHAVGQNQWSQYSNSSYLLNYKGESVRLHFRSTTDYSLPTKYRIDDVSVLATIPQGSGSLNVNIDPPGAVNAGAKWRRTGTSTWRSSGSTEANVPTGSYQVEFRDITGWTKPNNRSVTIDPNQTTYADGTYTPIAQYGSLLVTIEPANARTAGAQWRRTGTATWRNSGSTESSIPTGSYEVEFKDITGWTKPSNRSVTINPNQTTYADGTYTQVPQYGSLRVTIEPASARTAGAQWRRTETAIWRNSGSTESNIPLGAYEVEFNEISGWARPGNRSVTIEPNWTTFEYGTYTQQVGSLRVTIDPVDARTSGARWRVDGGSWETSGATLSGLSVGAHTLSFNDVPGWTRPEDQQVTIDGNQTTQASATYESEQADDTGACCIGTTCSVTTSGNCSDSWTQRATCDPDPCVTGACCIANECVSDYTELDCEADSGTWHIGTEHCPGCGEDPTGFYHPDDCWLLHQTDFDGPFFGENRSLSELASEFARLGCEYQIPVEILSATCYQERGLYQFDEASGFVIHNLAECRKLFNGTSSASPPGLGLMQLTGETALRFDPHVLVTDWRENLAAGAAILSRNAE